MKAKAPTMEDIKRDIYWLGEVVNVQSINDYTIAEYIEPSDKESRYIGYYYIDTENRYVRTDTCYKSFDKAMIHAMSERINSKDMKEAIFRLLGL